MSNVCRCTQPIPDTGQICTTCTLDLRDLLRTLALHTSDVAGAVARQRSSGATTFTKHRKWTPEAHPLPVDFDASDVGREIWDLATWAGRKVGAPARMPKTDRSAAALLLLAADEKDRLRMDDAAADVLDSARTVTRAVMALLDGPLLARVTRTYCGDCTCGVPLMAPVGAADGAVVACRACGATHHAGERLDAARGSIEDQWAALPVAVEWITHTTGRPAPAERTIRHWRATDQLPTNARGEVVIARYRDLEQRNHDITTRAGRKANA